MEIVTWLIEKGTIDKEDRELYEYAMYSIVISFVPLFVFIFVSFLLGYLKESFFIVLPFMVLRKYAGGFHANSIKKCFVWSNVLLFVGLYMVVHINSLVWTNYALVISTILICLLSPIDNEKYGLSTVEKKRLKKICIVILLICYLVMLVLFRLGYTKLLISESVGIVLVAFLQIVNILCEG